jgi:hypothetical protein
MRVVARLGHQPFVVEAQQRAARDGEWLAIRVGHRPVLHGRHVVVNLGFAEPDLSRAGFLVETFLYVGA